MLYEVVEGLGCLIDRRHGQFGAVGALGFFGRERLDPGLAVFAFAGRCFQPGAMSDVEG
jgi:hypothetical protein